MTGAEAATEAVPDQSERRSVALILLAMLGFAVQDMTVKVVASETSIWQMQLIRSVAVLVLLTLTVRLIGRSHQLVPTRWLWPVVRASLMTGAYLAFYTSLPFLTLAQAGTSFYVGPLLITLFAALLLGEPIGPRRVVAVGLGFIGVVLIVRPGSADWNPIALLPAFAAFCYALATVLTRWRCREQPGFALTFTHNVLYAALGALGLVFIPLVPVDVATREAWPFLLEGWQLLGGFAALLLLSTAATHIVGMMSSIAAYRNAEASKIAPLEYSYLLIMPVFDFVIWRHVPDVMTLAGMGLIIAGGSFVAWREGRPARPRVQFRNERSPGA